MILYADTSSLAKLYTDEDDAAEIERRISDATAVATSIIAYAEIRSALARRRRERTMTSREVSAARERFESDWANTIIIRCDDAIVRRAGDLADKHALRAADAIHLAAFERLLISMGDDEVEFSCADQRLNRAARSLG